MKFKKIINLTSKSLLILLQIYGISQAYAEEIVSRDSIINNYPASYDSFVELKKYERLEYAIENNNFIYLKPGEYQLNNPVILNRSKPLFIHGGDRVSTIIKPKDPSRPLFIVENATLINFSGLHFLAAKGRDNRTILFKNKSFLNFEVQDSFLDGGVIDVKGPGLFRMQGSYINNRGQNYAPIIIDHQDADFLSVGGNMTTGRGQKVVVPGDNIFNIWQKQGRIRVYGAGVQYGIGKADFRIDTPSASGPHVLAYVRSEGTNGYRSGDLPSSFLYVPSSNEKIDVLMMANAGQWPKESRNINHFVNYNAAGTVWMIGNASHMGANNIFSGDVDKATFVLLGNRIFNNSYSKTKLYTKDVFSLGNTYSHALAKKDKSFPYARFLENRITTNDFAHIPKLPRIELPDPLGRPVMHRAFSSMIDVKRDFGAKGDGIFDDTAALQKALISGKQIFIPEGIYRITKTLGYSHSKFGKKSMDAGGWLVGTGKNKSIIRRDYQDKGTVLTTEGMGYFTVQGISFETASFKHGAKKSISNSAIELEFNPKFKGAFATQEVSFYDCQFQGGEYAVSIGLDTGTMGSENMFINSVFKNARYGMAIGSYNALNNIVYGSKFINNEITIGHIKEKKSGGTASLLNVEIAGTKDQDVFLLNTSGEPWYFNGVKSASRKLFSAGHSSIPFQLIFDQCEFNPSSNKEFFIQSFSGGGFYFIHSIINSENIDISSKMSALPLFSIHSDFKNLNKAKVGKNGRIYKIH